MQHKTFVAMVVFALKTFQCSNLGFIKFPEFAEMFKLTTEKVMLKNIPQLDLSAFKTSEWINLEEIDLKGNPFISFFIS